MPQNALSNLIQVILASINMAWGILIVLIFISSIYLIQLSSYFVPGDDVLVSALYGWCLCVIGGHQLIFESGDGLDAFLLKSLQTSIESLLLSEESLYGGKVTSVVVRVHLKNKSKG